MRKRNWRKELNDMNWNIKHFTEILQSFELWLSSLVSWRCHMDATCGEAWQADASSVCVSFGIWHVQNQKQGEERLG